MLRLFGKLLRARRAGIAIYAAIALPVMAGMAGLGTEYASSLVTKTSNQRIADAAAYAGATVYINTSSWSSATAAVAKVATLNGLTSAEVVPALVASPRPGSSNQAVRVVVTTPQNVALSRLVSSMTSLSIASTGYAEISLGTTPACVVALSSSGTGIQVENNGTVSAAGCAIASNSSYTACGTSGTAASVTTPSVTIGTGTGATYSGCGVTKTSSGSTVTATQRSTADPVPASVSTAAATNFSTTHALPALTLPSTWPITTYNLNFNSSSSPGTLPSGCSYGTGFNSSTNTWTVTCNAGATYNFGTISVTGGVSVSWQTANGGSATTATNYNFTNGLGISSYAGTATFAGGTNIFYNIGAYSSSSWPCPNDTYSICEASQGTLSFTGPVTMTLYNGLGISQGTLSIGSGSQNAYILGGSKTNGYAIYNSGGIVNFAGAASTDSFCPTIAVSSASVEQCFYVTNSSNSTASTGSIYQTAGCTTLPTLSSTTPHYIKGNVITSGGLIMGGVVYAIDGYFYVGSASGPSSCTTLTLSAVGVTLEIAGNGASAATCTSYTGYAFCDVNGVGATLSAPTSGSTNGYAIIMPATSSAGVMFAAGGPVVNVSGIIYAPDAPVTVTNGARLSDGGSAANCLEVIGSQVTIGNVQGGGPVLTTSCTAASLGGSSTSSTAMLVQ